MSVVGYFGFLVRIPERFFSVCHRLDYRNVDYVSEAWKCYGIAVLLDVLLFFVQKLLIREFRHVKRCCVVRHVVGGPGPGRAEIVEPELACEAGVYTTKTKTPILPQTAPKSVSSVSTIRTGLSILGICGSSSHRD